ncbi:hypothetical protein HELRODRAFT_167900 [Helobdella robusta]|uniref:Uncharacterized protein n=1 Tax=Helobdella robusta TaxID=6412 RepID=T1EZX8_HELRO|nr:hypothetical protein HELRODRAFT_167900 [Helobdella robusta]ESO10055.1 hypothetical protein HELRODRAFT_167900 [Helobdella robusta]
MLQTGEYSLKQESCGQAICSCFKRQIYYKLGAHQLKLGAHQLKLGAHQIKLGTHQLKFGAHQLKLGTHQLKMGAHQLKLGTPKQKYQLAFKVKLDSFKFTLNKSCAASLFEFQLQYFHFLLSFLSFFINYPFAMNKFFGMIVFITWNTFGFYLANKLLSLLTTDDTKFETVYCMPTVPALVSKTSLGS